ncbi:MAG: hypothetical protein FWD56_06115 [Bacteroidales bacterium]|nr:hypothetical protein [Bacteroidales bacterium]
MKKTLFLLVAVGVFMLIGCGGSGSGGGKVSGEVYTTQEMSVLAPKGWKAFSALKPGTTDEYRDDQVNVHKGAKVPLDQFNTSGIVINYWEDAKNVMAPPKSWYENVEEIAPFTLGNYQWEGFTGERSDITYGILWTINAEERFQVVAFLKYRGMEISLEDADVKAIIASISKK